MRQLLTGKQMKEADTYSIQEFGMESLVLMERAALAVAQHILSGRKSGRVFLLCGMGNNGADGLAAARLLFQKGWQVSVLAVGNTQKATREWNYQKKLLDKMNIEVVCTDRQENFRDALSALYPAADVYVDALFGVGLCREVTGIYREAIEEWNAHKERFGAYGVAVDICSGVDAGSGRVLGACIRADVQITFGYAKIGQFLYPGADAAKETIVCDIGFPAQAIDHIGGASVCCLEKEDAFSWLLRRCPWGNKGTFGRVLVIAGSEGMAGAAYLSAMAAYRTGAGLVEIVTPECNRPILQQLLPEALLHGIPQECDPAQCSISPKSPEEKLRSWLEAITDRADAIVVGPGLSKSSAAEAIFDAVLALNEQKELSRRCPLIIDADGLNLLAQKETCCLGSNVILTPHPGELGRLLGISAKEAALDLAHHAGLLRDRFGCVCVCKDARTVILPAEDDLNQQMYLNLTGNCGMAVGGSGDVLTGVIASLAAQGLDASRSAILGVWLHGAAGDEAAKEKSPYSMIARDLLDGLSKVLVQKGRKKV